MSNLNFVHYSLQLTRLKVTDFLYFKYFWGVYFKQWNIAFIALQQTEIF